ncbi:Anaerobic sulfite reductase subunit A [subsurface metagenome]
MQKILLKKNLSSWLKQLNSYKIYAPFKTGEVWSYELIEKPENINLDYPNTIIPPKKVLFPQREVLLEFESSTVQEIKLKEVIPEETPSVIFGIRSCDARGLAKLEKIFKGGFEDIYFSKRNSKTVLVGFACETPPSPDCFCTSVDGSPYSKEGLDILMTDIGDRYHVESITKKGEKLLEAGIGLFNDPEETDKEKLERIHRESEKKIKRHIKDINKISSKLPEIFETEFWDKESLSCIRCGICTYSCPVCHCFDINDEVICTFPLKGKRVRTWDNCQFPDFTMHSSGHNPRSDKASRLRQRIMHKFNYFNENCKEPLCTGCGRCISKCPVGIDIVEVLEKVRVYEK